VIGTTFSGRFLLEQELGRGGMGAVYRAADQILDRHVAIKVLKDLQGDEVARKIRLEAQILARLVHEHIVRLYDLGIDDHTYYFVMEEVRGSSFQKRWKKLDFPDRFRVLAQVADALDYAHHQGVIHRDVKPANILMTESDQPKLSDFGLSTFASQVAAEARTVKGTPHYMSPEQARGLPIDHRTDLYALGVILYECATGSVPFSGQTMAVLSQQVNAQPEPVRARNPGASPELEALIHSLLAKSPDQRPHTGREVAEQLRLLIASDRLGTSAARDQLPPAQFPAPSLEAGQATPTRPAPAPVPSAPPRIPQSVAAHAPGCLSRHELVRTIVDAVEADPVFLTPDQRYAFGHYLAYLLGGARRTGLLRRRTLDPLNSDRARVLLALAGLSLPNNQAISMGQAASLLDDRPDCRPALSPIAVAKYLAARSSPDRLKDFRKLRAQLLQASTYATEHLADARGVLNPGLMPQRVEDLLRLAPARTEVDDELVARWNAVSDVWRENPQFREAVLRYATADAWKDPASATLWPEVVYPLIERARRQRHLRNHIEAFWDMICERLRFLPDDGVKLDQAFSRNVPEQIVAQLDRAAAAFEDEDEVEEEPLDAEDRLELEQGLNPATLQELNARTPERGYQRLSDPNPQRFTMGELRALWKESLAAARAAASPGRAPAARGVPIGPYRLVAIPSIRVRAAGQVAIQGMANKQIELIVPSFTGGGSAERPVVAVWTYPNASLAITYTDNLGAQKFIAWDAAAARQFNFDHAVLFNQTLDQLGLEVPTSLDSVLTRKYRGAQ
jgi:serine/threonine-protein kinase